MEKKKINQGTVHWNAGKRLDGRDAALCGVAFGGLGWKNEFHLANPRQLLPEGQIEAFYLTREEDRVTCRVCQQRLFQQSERNHWLGLDGLIDGAREAAEGARVLGETLCTGQRAWLRLRIQDVNCEACHSIFRQTMAQLQAGARHAFDEARPRAFSEAPEVEQRRLLLEARLEYWCKRWDLPLHRGQEYLETPGLLARASLVVRERDGLATLASTGANIPRALLVLANHWSAPVRRETRSVWLVPEDCLWSDLAAFCERLGAFRDAYAVASVYSLAEVEDLNQAVTIADVFAEPDCVRCGEQELRRITSVTRAGRNEEWFFFPSEGGGWLRPTQFAAQPIGFDFEDATTIVVDESEETGEIQ